MRWSQIGSIATLVLIGQGALAQSDEGTALDMPAQCDLRGQSKLMRILVCEPGLDQEVLAEAGRAACAGQIPCGAWIWTSVEDIPESAPETHGDLTQQQVTSATAAWVAEDDMRVMIDKKSK